MTSSTFRSAPIRILLRCGRAIAVLAVLGVVASACAGAQETDEMPVDRTVVIPSPVGDRTAIVHHPASARPGAPLVIVSHGANGTAADAQRFYGWDALADRDGFVVAYPQGLDKRWNAGLCCRGSRPPDVDDVAFLRELRQRVIDVDGVAPDRVAAVGVSNGGMLSLRWACEDGRGLAAVGVVAAVLTVPCAEPDAVSVVSVHGAQDATVPLGGGVALGVTDLPSVMDSLSPFIQVNRCGPDGVESVAGTATVTTWTCPDSRKVVSDVIGDVGHTWPGASGGRAGTTEAPTDATGFLWAEMRVALGT